MGGIHLSWQQNWQTAKLTIRQIDISGTLIEYLIRLFCFTFLSNNYAPSLSAATFQAYLRSLLVAIPHKSEYQTIWKKCCSWNVSFSLQLHLDSRVLTQSCYCRCPRISQQDSSNDDRYPRQGHLLYIRAPKENKWLIVGTEIGVMDDAEPINGHWMWQAHLQSEEVKPTSSSVHWMLSSQLWMLV